jgi:hypothetical protein
MAQVIQHNEETAIVLRDLILSRTNKEQESISRLHTNATAIVAMLMAAIATVEAHATVLVAVEEATAKRLPLIARCYA